MAIIIQFNDGEFRDWFNRATAAGLKRAGAYLASRGCRGGTK